MSILNNLDEIRSKLNLIDTIFDNIVEDISILTGIEDVKIQDVPNIIYNFNIEESNKKDFNLIDLSNPPTGSGILDFKAKIQYIESVKISILNALRARLMDIDSRTSFELYPTLIEETLSGIGGDDRLELLKISSVPGTDYYTTKLAVEIPEKYQHGTVYYTHSNMLPLPSVGNIFETYYELSSDQLYVENNEPIVVFVMDNETNEILISGMVNCKTKVPVNPVKISIESNPGVEYKSAILSISPKLVEGNKYFYRKFTQDIIQYKGDYISTEGYIEYDPDDLFFGDSSVYTFIEVDENSCLYGITELYITTREYATKYKISTEVLEENKSVRIINNNIQVEGSEYFYCIGEDTPLDEEDLDETRYLSWTPETVIEAKQGDIITLVETVDNQIVKYGNCVVLFEVKELEKLNITSVPGDKNGYTYINLPMSENNFYYKESYSYAYPSYGDIITDDFILIENPEILMSVNTRLLVVEVKDRMIIGAGYCTVNIKTPKLETIILLSEEGSYTGYTKLFVLDNQLDEGNRYVYRLGNNTTAYNKDLTDWNDWNPNEEIYCGLEDTTITVAEVTQMYRARKIGVITANVRPVELSDLEISSRKGSIGGYTKLYVTPYRNPGNTYKYTFGNIKVSLYQDVSDWNDWDGNAEIASDDGVMITVVECIEDNKVLKVGSTLVRAKEPDPVLGTLTVISEQGSNTGYTFITVDPPLTDGYQYCYKFTSQVPEYHESAADWFAWDGKSEIKANPGVLICVAECTTDGFITKAGICICHTK